jgi:hypothetical protein
MPGPLDPSIHEAIVKECQSFFARMLFVQLQGTGLEQYINDPSQQQQKQYPF